MISVYDDTLSRIGFIEGAVSYMAELRRTSAGDFTLWMDSTANNLDMVTRGRLIAIDLDFIEHPPSEERNFVLQGAAQQSSYIISSEAPKALHGSTACLQIEYTLTESPSLSGTCELELAYTLKTGETGSAVLNVLSGIVGSNGLVYTTVEIPKNVKSFEGLTLTMTGVSGLTIKNLMLSKSPIPMDFVPAVEDDWSRQPVKQFWGLLPTYSLSEEDNFEGIRVTGKSLEDVLKKRCFWGPYMNKDTYQNIFEDVIAINFINPEVTNRVLPYLTIGRSPRLDGTKVTYQKTGGYVSENLESLIRCTDLGIQAVFDSYLKEVRLYLYKGKDRSSKLVFSDTNGMLISPSYTHDSNNYKTTALVAGEDSGENRKYLAVGDEASGWDRDEVFIDARDLQSLESDGTQITEEEYYALLEQRGIEKLSAYALIQSFESNISAYGYALFTDYDLGDIVTARHSIGITAVRPIESITITNSSGDVSLQGYFGSGRLTLAGMLKARLN